jgi:MoxR-like ATPase
MPNEAEQFDALPTIADRLRIEIAKRIVGQKDVIEEMLIALFSNGHCIFVGVPGLAKTLMVNTISETLGLGFRRIQFTPDLMPSDITGAEILNEDKETGRRSLEFVKGPIFTNLLLADEINRTPPKTQAALLESMQEKQVTTLGKTHKLDLPFLVFATQNPVEQEGTYPLPEAALDRFMFSIMVDYPSQSDEMEIVRRITRGEEESIEQVLHKDELITYHQLLQKVPISDEVITFATTLVKSTRPGEGSSEMVQRFVRYGAGTRASIFLTIAARTRAALLGHETPSKKDVRAVAKTVLRHRIICNFQAEAQGITGDQIIESLLERM